MFLAEIDLKSDAIVIIIGFLIQGGALSALWVLWRHHVKTIADHKRELVKKETDKTALIVAKDADVKALIIAKDADVKALIIAKDAEIKARVDACRSELVSCQADMREMEREFRFKIEEYLREAHEHDNEMLAQIREELRPGGKK